MSPAASASTAPSNAGEARNPAASPAVRANRPSPTGLPPPSIATGAAFSEQIAGGTNGGCGAAISVATAELVRATLAGAVVRKSVAKRLPSQYQRWSALCPPIITAARSLPAMATLRLAGDALLSRSPSVVPFRCIGDTVYAVDELPGTRSSSAQ